MRRARPAAVLVIAILHFVGGGIGILYDLCGLAGQVLKTAIMSGSFGPMPQNNGQLGSMQDLETRIPGYQAMQYAQLSAGLVLSGFMIVAGVGLVQMRPWGRFLSIVYAVVSIVTHIGEDIYNFGYVVPGMQSLMRDAAAKEPQLAKTGFGSMMESFVMIGPALQALLIIYPIVVLIIMLLPSVRAAFLAPPVAPRSADDFDEDEPDEEPLEGRHGGPNDRTQPDES
jgi:hypothetical protein